MGKPDSKRKKHQWTRLMTGRQRCRYIHQQRGYTQDHLQNVSHFHFLKQCYKDTTSNSENTTTKGEYMHIQISFFFHRKSIYVYRVPDNDDHVHQNTGLVTLPKGFRSSAMWYCVIQCEIHYVSKQHCTFIFKRHTHMHTHACMRAHARTHTHTNILKWI